MTEEKKNCEEKNNCLAIQHVSDRYWLMELISSVEMIKLNKTRN